MLVIQHYDFDGAAGNEMAPGKRQYLHASETRTQTKIITTSDDGEVDDQYHITSQRDDPDSTQVNIQVTSTDGKRL